nr:hypothetical protein [Vibrio parahaemolyticus]
MRYILVVILFISTFVYSAPKPSCGSYFGYLEKVLTTRELEGFKSQKTMIERANFLKKINAEKHSFIDGTFSLEPTLVNDSLSHEPVGIKITTGDDRERPPEGFPRYTFQEVTFRNDRHWIVHAMYRRAGDPAHANDLFRALYLNARKVQNNGKFVLKGLKPRTITRENIVNGQTVDFLENNNWKPGDTYKYKSNMVNKLLEASPNAKSTMNILADFGLELDSITYEYKNGINLIFNIKQ